MAIFLSFGGASNSSFSRNLCCVSPEKRPGKVESVSNPLARAKISGARSELPLASPHQETRRGECRDDLEVPLTARFLNFLAGAKR